MTGHHSQSLGAQTHERLLRDAGLTWGFILHLFLAGCFTYGFLRAWGFAFFPSLVAGIESVKNVIMEQNRAELTVDPALSSIGRYTMNNWQYDT